MQKKCVMLPGAFNGLVGRLVAEAGFEGTYISGAAISGAAGLPDIGVHSLESFCRSIKEVSMASGLPLIADADTGFGEAEMVTRTVWEYHQAGAAGLHMEDQVFPKRCGHLDGKSLVGTSDFVEKVKRAVAASKACSEGSFVVCARTDARGVEGMDAALERARVYAEAGADMIFPEGLNNEEEFETFAKEMRKVKAPHLEAPGGGPYLLANMTEYGKTPLIPHARFAALGYHCVIFPVSTLRVAMRPVQELLETLQKTGSVEAIQDRMYDRKSLYKSLGYTPGVEWTYPSSITDRKKE
uniref:Methylisocitrate lyase n=1 Tax=Chromera velia CCMP2878 TaxID=1169474 RepID=A0A0G4GC67_9ALVE|eukprot:Cvel_4464.t1-p1 / transcript=Cvel_4464.t1 / gene=Cvel_4464 / organism=Chromera_velia_CCMP2878 / gene_product=Probable methylisocitrate lyase 1, putative / transcript_product=Probable methylisocitrate lyase 1, putative / location=Cvel_scaffold195:44259-47269(+) / protein_length=297 / sequence_SO=supercontig / SO=protein_coding / is_pseudo=false